MEYVIFVLVVCIMAFFYVRFITKRYEKTIAFQDFLIRCLVIRLEKVDEDFEVSDDEESKKWIAEGFYPEMKEWHISPEDHLVRDES